MGIDFGNERGVNLSDGKFGKDAVSVRQLNRVAALISANTVSAIISGVTAGNNIVITGNTSTTAITISLTENVVTNSLSATTLSGSTIFSGNTDIGFIFASKNHTHNINISDVNNLLGSLNTKANLSGATFTSQITAPILSATTISADTIFVHTLSGFSPINIEEIIVENDTLRGGSLSGTSVSASTFYSGSTDLSEILTNLLSGGTGQQVFIQDGLNTYTGGTETLPTINVSALTIDSINVSGSSIFNSVTSLNTTLGNPEDGTYSDGLFTDITSATTVGVFSDRVNEILKSLSPPPAPDLDNWDSQTSGSSGKLSFGTAKTIVGYTNATGIGTLSAVDLNGTFSNNSPTERTGIFGTASTLITVLLNSDVPANTNTPTPAFPAFSFGEGETGRIELELNGSIVNTLPISGTTGSTSNTLSNTTISVSASDSVKFPLGSPLDLFKWRTGTVTINQASWIVGWNYARIIHNRGANSAITNYVDFIFDNDPNNISSTGGTMDVPTMTGLIQISGVKFFTAGSTTYFTVLNNVYRNIYSSGNAFSVSNTNVSHSTTISGSGLTSSSNFSSSSSSLPSLSAVTDTENTPLDVNSTLTITATKLLTSDSITFAVACTHPISSKNISAGSTTASKTGFLMWNISDTNTDKLADFSGESRRLQNVAFSAQTYTDINSGTFVWDSTEDLVSGDTQHNTGLLIYNGKLTYPTSSYSFNSGNFRILSEGGLIPNGQGPTGNVNYSSATGTRDLYWKFKSSNAASQGSLSFTITKLASTTFSQTGSNLSPTPSGDELVLECLVVKTDNSKFGYFNPLSSSDNTPSDVAIIGSPSGMGGSTLTFSTTLGVSFVVGNGDIIIVRIKGASSWSGYVEDVQITNI